jgi:hypothetical protein
VVYDSHINRTGSMIFSTAALAAITAAGITSPSDQLIACVTFTTEVIRCGTGCSIEAAAAEAFATWADIA